jgi:uncharacterized protein (DUF983 family)
MDAPFHCPACGGPLLDEELPKGTPRACAACGSTVHRELATDDHGLSLMFRVHPEREVHLRTSSPASR